MPQNSSKNSNKATDTKNDSKNDASPSHISLYRKYRPSTFDEVIGQDHIVSVLKQSIEQGKISHAYLFCGSRGTGKTSIARIFAKALGTSQNDLYEIDAASNTSVDDIRELSEAVNTVPFESRYKIYILDEVHMLSKSAFNAFLKTLEEPPKHVIFILATTETEKLPDTIVSRCEVYNFKKPTVDVLKKVVSDTAKKEGADIEPAAAELIALLGDGSFRDTHGTLQKVLSFAGVNGGAKNAGAEGKGASNSDKKITLAEVEEITGAPKSSIVLDFVRGLLLKDGDIALRALQNADKENLDMKIFAKLAIVRLRYLLMKTVSEIEAKKISSDLSVSDIQALDEIVKNSSVTAPQVVDILRKILEIYNSIGKTHIQSLPLEVLVGEVCR